MEIDLAQLALFNTYRIAIYEIHSCNCYVPDARNYDGFVIDITIITSILLLSG
jgi:hypothetical protein